MFGGMLYFKYLHHPLTGYHAKTFIETPLPLLTVVLLPDGGAEHPDGRPRRDGHADLLRVAVEDDLPARRDPPKFSRDSTGFRRPGIGLIEVIHPCAVKTDIQTALADRGWTRYDLFTG